MPRKRLETIRRYITSNYIQINSSRVIGIASIAIVYFKVWMAKRLVRAEGNTSRVGYLKQAD